MYTKNSNEDIMVISLLTSHQCTVTFVGITTSNKKFSTFISTTTENSYPCI